MKCIVIAKNLTTVESINSIDVFVLEGDYPQSTQPVNWGLPSTYEVIGVLASNEEMPDDLVYYRDGVEVDIVYDAPSQRRNDEGDEEEEDEGVHLTDKGREEADRLAEMDMPAKGHDSE